MPRKSGLIRGAVHLGTAVGVDRSPVLGHHGMPQSPADAARLARFPRLHRRLGDPGGEELRVLRRLHDAVLGDLVIPFLHDGRRVGVRGVEHQLLDVEVGEPVLRRAGGPARGPPASIATRSHETMIARSRTLSPSLDSRARAVAVTGLSTSRATRVCIWPASATGRSGVMLTVARPDVELGGPAFRRVRRTPGRRRRSRWRTRDD